ncbi:hypothetical protein H5410_055348 [Solanum commersonii]|uniref:Uncharacterized protein n=1 Tax=Solanum commersonii TaxID=4109 RepID=A0A9J5WK20_SOLCO|nr:hypothetical protein H5410_055348 [Solanum commersonii]
MQYPADFHLILLILYQSQLPLINFTSLLSPFSATTVKNPTFFPIFLNRKENPRTDLKSEKPESPDFAYIRGVLPHSEGRYKKGEKGESKKSRKRKGTRSKNKQKRGRTHTSNIRSLC